MMLGVMSAVFAIGFRENWRMWPVKMTAIVLSLTFLTSYLVEGQPWYTGLVERYFYTEFAGADI
jgi:hypothetical protein